MIDALTEKLPANLRLSISNLWERIGSTDAPLTGLAINLSLAATGLVGILAFSDPVISAVCASWMLLNLFGILKWVFGL